MNRLDKWISAIVLGLIAPVLLMLLFWWGSIPFVGENIVIAFMAFGGFIIGIVLDITVLKKFILRLFALPKPALFAIALYYSILIYGFFMGLPVFNAFVGIACAYVVARGCALRSADRQAMRKEARSVNLFSFILLFLICVYTAVLSLREASITSQVQHMLGLPFEVTDSMIWAIIIAGGMLLLAFQYGISKLIFFRLEKKALPG
jgi:hypothetical protein